MNFHKLVSSLFVSCCLALPYSFFSYAGAQDEKPVYETLDVNVRLEYVNRSVGWAQFGGTTWVPALEAGKKYKIKLRVDNSSSTPLVFDNVETSCQCGTFRLDETTVPAKQHVKGELIWSVPGSGERNRAGVMATLFLKGQPQAEISIRAYLKGNLYVGNVSEGQRLDAGMFEWKIPIVTSEPLELKHFELSLSEKLDGFAVSMEKLDKPSVAQVPSSGQNPPRAQRGIITILAPESIVGNDFRFGELTVADPSSRKRFKRSLALYTRPPVRVSPVSLFFQQKKDSDDLVVAQALLQIDLRYFKLEGLDEASASQDETEFSLKAKLSLNGTAVPVKTVHLAKTVYRLKVTCKKNLFESSKKVEGNWIVSVNDRDFKIPVSASFR